MHDVIIVGGSYAGLAAALQLGRARRDVLVLDAGQRRNRAVAHAHGILGFDGAPPSELAARGRAEVSAYPTVRIVDAEAVGARPIAGGFAIDAGGEEHRGRRLVLATGVVDTLPPIAGLAERWGRSVFPCPYCDGYELHRGKLGVVAWGPIAHHYATIVSEWGEVTLFLHGGESPSSAELAALGARGIRVEPGPIAEARDAASGVALVLADGTSHAFAGVFALSLVRVPGPFARDLGCELESAPNGQFYKTDPRTKETTVRGVFACGDAGQGQHAVTFALADGARAGISAHQSLVFATEHA